MISSANKMTKQKRGKGKPDGSNKEGSSSPSRAGNPKTGDQGDDSAVPPDTVLPKPSVISPNDQTLKNTEAIDKKVKAKPPPTVALIPPTAGNIPLKPSLAPPKAQRGALQIPI